VSPHVYSYDDVSGRGGCCPSGQGWAYDANASQGGCCPGGTGKRWMMDSTKVGPIIISFSAITFPIIYAYACMVILC